jgi:glycosyltransferase involved in cell wall biosynthesis
VVTTCHGSDLQGIVGADGSYSWKSAPLRSVSRLVARRSTQVIIVAEHLANHLPEGLQASVIPCGLDLQMFRPASQDEARQRLGLPLDRRLALFAANPRNPVKRYELATAAVAQVTSGCAVELVALDGIPHDLVPAYMNACEVLLLTSRHEGSPMVVKEALACNLPVVSTDVGDVRQLVGAIDGCEVCRDESPEAIASALARVLERGRPINGRAAVQHLDEDRLARQVLDVFERAIAQRRTARDRETSPLGKPYLHGR